MAVSFSETILIAAKDNEVKRSSLRWWDGLCNIKDLSDVLAAVRKRLSTVIVEAVSLQQIDDSKLVYDTGDRKSVV